MNEQVLSTARLVRPSYRTPVTVEPESYLETLERQRDLAQNENRELKASLIQLQAELESVRAIVDERDLTIQLLTGSRDAAPIAPAYTMPPRDLVPKTLRRWIPGHVRLGDRFPVDLAKRTGIAAFIQRPLVLRSGAVLEPVLKTAVRGGRSCQFPDSSWLVLSVLAQRPGAWVTRRELADLLFPGQRDSSVRSAVLRARQTLEAVQADQDLETSGNLGVGWRLLLEGTPS